MTSQTSMDALPKEILSEIFMFCDRKDLLNLTLTCTSFNDIISTNSLIMKRLHLNISRNHADNEWNATRKYTGLYIYKMHSELPKIFNHVQNDLTKLRIVAVDIKASDLKNILLKSPKLNNLALNNINFEYDNESFEEPLPRLTLSEGFSLSCDRNILRMLYHCQIKRYTGFRVSTNPDEIISLRMFLKNQKQLEHIDFFCFENDCELFDDDTLNTVDFRLKTLKIQDFETNFEATNFIKFLKNHRDSLKYLDMTMFRRSLRNEDLSHAEILKCVASFRNMKKLHLSKINVIIDEPMPYVEDLTLKNMNYGPIIDWAKFFPNVKKLELHRVKNPSELEKLKKLESLVLCGYDKFTEIKLPATVKSLEMFEIWTNYLRPFDYEQQQLESLKVEYCEDADWLGDFLRSLSKKLKFLWIERTFLTRHRRFARLFEKEPNLKDMAEKFVFIDWKDDLDEDSIASDDDNEEFDYGEYDVLVLDKNGYRVVAGRSSENYPSSRKPTDEELAEFFKDQPHMAKKSKMDVD